MTRLFWTWTVIWGYFFGVVYLLSICYRLRYEWCFPTFFWWFKLILFCLNIYMIIIPVYKIYMGEGATLVSCFLWGSTVWLCASSKAVFSTMSFHFRWTRNFFLFFSFLFLVLFSGNLSFPVISNISFLLSLLSPYPCHSLLFFLLSLTCSHGSFIFPPLVHFLFEHSISFILSSWFFFLSTSPLVFEHVKFPSYTFVSFSFIFYFFYILLSFGIFLYLVYFCLLP